MSGRALARLYVRLHRALSSYAAAKSPTGERWVHEIKVAGYSCQLPIRHGAVNAFTRQGHDWASRFAAVAQAAKELPIKEAVIDGL